MPTREEGGPPFSGRMRRHGKIAIARAAVAVRRVKSLPPRPDLLPLRALRPEAAAHEKSSLKRELFRFGGKNMLRQAQRVRGRQAGGSRQDGHAAPLPLSPGCPGPRPSYQHWPGQGGGIPSREAATGTVRALSGKVFGRKEGTRGRKGAPFSKGALSSPVMTAPQQQARSSRRAGKN